MTQLSWCIVFCALLKWCPLFFSSTDNWAYFLPVYCEKCCLIETFDRQLAYKHLKAIIDLLYFVYAIGKETNYDFISQHVLLLENVIRNFFIINFIFWLLALMVTSSADNLN